MGFFDRLRKALAGGGGSADRPDTNAYWVFVQCQRCGEPLRTRIDLRNDLSEEDDGTFTVHKGLIGGARRCFQTVEVELHFNADRRQVLDRQISGGRWITAEEYQALAQEPWPPPEEQEEYAQTDNGRQLEDEQDARGSDRPGTGAGATG